VIVAIALGWWIDRQRIRLDITRLRFEYSVGQKDYYRRLNAVKQLGLIGNRQSIPALLYSMGDPDFTVCDSASKSLSSITGMNFRPPTSLDPTRDYSVYSESERDQLRELFQNERDAWLIWLEQNHPDMNPAFDPYEKVAGNIDVPAIWWNGPKD